MTFTTNSRVSIMLLALLFIAPTALAHKEGDDPAAPHSQSLSNSLSPSSEGVGSAKPEGLVDVGLCALECGARCFGGKPGSHNFSPAKFRFGKIWKKLPFGKAICMSTCMLECTINQENVKPELYRCSLGCAYKSAAITKLNGSDAHKRDNYLGTCYNKCEESYQG